MSLEGTQYKIQICSLVCWENISNMYFIFNKYKFVFICFVFCHYFIKAKASEFCRKICMDRYHSSLLGMTSHLWDVQCLKCVNTVLAVREINVRLLLSPSLLYQGVDWTMMRTAIAINTKWDLLIDFFWSKLRFFLWYPLCFLWIDLWSKSIENWLWRLWHFKIQSNYDNYSWH